MQCLWWSWYIRSKYWLVNTQLRCLFMEYLYLATPFMQFYTQHECFLNVARTKRSSIWPHNLHEDVIKWKHFPRYWPFMKGPRWSPRTKASDAELWCFFDLRRTKRLSKQSWGWWFETLSWPLWRHCYDDYRMQIQIFGWLKFQSRISELHNFVTLWRKRLE